MASTRRRKSTAVVDQVQHEPKRFEFYQLIRLLELAAQQQPELTEQGQPVKRRFATIPIAQDAPPHREALRLRGQTSLAFRGTDIEDVTIVDTIAPDDIEEPERQWEVMVNIFGLMGSGGVLPHHFSEQVIQRLRLKDASLLDFIDVLNHRSISLLYQAWHKYRLPVTVERHRAQGYRGQDLFSQILSSLVGLGTAHLQERLPIPDEALSGFAGLLHGRPPSAPTLQRILRHYFELPIHIDQFLGQWQTLPIDMQSRLPGRECPKGLNNQLGVNSLLGHTCWQIQSKFRIRIDRLNYSQYMDIAPNGQKMAQLKALTRFIVGNELDFDIAISIARSELPPMTLGTTSNTGEALLLGWNSPLGSAEEQHNRFAEADNELIEILVAA